MYRNICQIACSLLNLMCTVLRDYIMKALVFFPSETAVWHHQVVISPCFFKEYTRADSLIACCQDTFLMKHAILYWTHIIAGGAGTGC